MPQGGVDANLPVLPARVGFVAGSGVAGIVALVTLVGTSSSPLATLAGGGLFALFFGGLCWLLQRGRQDRLLERLPTADGPGHGGPPRALLGGLLTVDSAPGR